MTEDDLRLERGPTLATRLEYPLRADRVRLDDVAGAPGRHPDPG